MKNAPEIVHRTRFQYQKGAIKTALQLARQVLVQLFQYQKGAIKTYPERACAPIAPVDFNTKKVRLKRAYVACRET